jgi:hypothetical protein
MAKGFFERLNFEIIEIDTKKEFRNHEKHISYSTYFNFWPNGSGSANWPSERPSE